MNEVALRVAWWLHPERLGRVATQAFAIAAAAYVVLVAVGRAGDGIDARAYWLVNPSDPYSVGPSNDDAFLYSPAIAQLLGPFTQLPWPVFLATLTAASLAALIWMAGPWSIVFAISPWVATELYMGNINLLLAAAIVLGFRWPAAWAFVLLTKVTPGIGLLWFAFRRQWRHLAVAALATAAIAAVSFVLAPSLWTDWAGLLVRSAGAGPYPLSDPTPLWLRVAIAVALLWAGALRDKPQVVPIAAMLASPVLWGHALSMVVGAVAVLRMPGLVEDRVAMQNRSLQLPVKGRPARA